FCLFYGMWSIGYYNALPNLNVFMIRELKLSFTQVAFYQNCQFFMMLAGYALWPRYIHKFGAKSVILFCLIPLIILPFVWFTIEQYTQIILIPAMMIYGLCVSCVILGASTHLFAMIPKDERSPAYLVCWSVIVFLSMAIGPKIGSICINMFKEIHFSVGYFNIMNIKIALLTVSLFYGLSFVLLSKLRVTGTVSATVLVDQIFRRNPLSLAYNMFVLEKSQREEPRAVALEKLGKSGSAMALETLVGSLTDISPVVRRQAASSIGETKLKEAASPLADIISDPESDIKIEASQALGMINTQESADALWSAIDDPNPAVRASAVRSLGSFPGGNIDNKLMDLLYKETNPITFLAIVKTVGERHSLDAIKILLQRYNMFKSSRIRVQILNAIAMIFGKGNEYYAVISSGKENMELSIEEYFESNYKKLEKIRNDKAKKIYPYIEAMLNSCQEKNTQNLYENFLSLHYYITQQYFNNRKIDAASMAIHTFITSTHKAEETYLQEVAFLALCAQVIIDELTEI
ncbi:MAG: MFS transporter, partial [Candidatus Latescibacteria bacterium]|nr:MFS transporter [Candidatus Latescibacterota bacterium]